MASIMYLPSALYAFYVFFIQLSIHNSDNKPLLFLTLLNAVKPINSAYL